MSGQAHKIIYNTATGQVNDRFGNPIGNGTDVFNTELRRVHTENSGNLQRAEPETREERQQRALNAAFRRLAGRE